jgi:hypothetical protein
MKIWHRALLLACVLLISPGLLHLLGHGCKRLNQFIAMLDTNLIFGTTTVRSRNYIVHQYDFDYSLHLSGLLDQQVCDCLSSFFFIY